MVESNNDIMFSVMMTVYNQEEGIERTMESLLNMDHDYKYEIVVGDDGSVDRSREILRGYADKYPDIIKLHFHEKNLGLVRNYYYLISQCRGKYIGLCSAEDEWLPEKPKKQVEYMEAHPEVGVVYARSYMDYEEGYSGPRFETIGQKVDSYKDMLFENYMPGHTVFYRNTLAKQYIEEERPIEKGWLCEDYHFWLWFGMNTKIHFIDEPLAVYYVKEGSLSRMTNKVKWFAMMRSYHEIRKHYAERYYKPGEVPLDIKELYTYNIFKGAVANKDYKRLKELRGDVEEIKARDRDNKKVSKMLFGIKYPRLYRTASKMIGKYK